MAGEFLGRALTEIEHIRPWASRQGSLVFIGLHAITHEHNSRVAAGVSKTISNKLRCYLPHSYWKSPSDSMYPNVAHVPVTKGEALELLDEINCA